MSKVPSLTFGALLKRYRLEAGLTQEELAERAALSTNAVSALERGARQVPRKETVALLADALKLSEQERAILEAAARRLRGSMTGPPASPLGLASTAAASAGALTPLVGRTHEVALLERHLSGAAPPALFFTGEPGIGKTRLLHEAALRADDQGWRVLQGGCHSRGGQEPYAPLPGVLERALSQLALAECRKALDGCAWLVRLLPELTELVPAPAWPLLPEQERRLLFAAVGRFLSNIAGPRGTLLVLDDLQWAGADAFDLLASLLQDMPGKPVRLVGAYRSTEVRAQDALHAFLADLAAAGRATQLELDPLSPQEAGELLNTLLEVEETDAAALAHQVLRRSSGVPFFLVSYARDAQTGSLDRSAAGVVPWDVAQSTRQRIAALPEAARELLGIAAVIGDVAPSKLLIALAAQPEKETLAALEAACQAGLLEEEGEDGYALTHNLIREVTLAELGAARRKLLHRRVAEILEQSPGDPPIERLAYHYTRAGEPEKAVVYLEQAADHAQAVYASAKAEGYYREVISQLESLARAPEAARIREKLGKLLSDSARYEEAIGVLERAAASYRAAGDQEALRRVSAEIAQVHTRRGTE
jgi:predicted ATPase/DNA-binding XRE family transcriptional regulator